MAGSLCGSSFLFPPALETAGRVSFRHGGKALRGPPENLRSVPFPTRGTTRRASLPPRRGRSERARQARRGTHPDAAPAHPPSQRRGSEGIRKGVIPLHPFPWIQTESGAQGPKPGPSLLDSGVSPSPGPYAAP